jgi:hypothetical protein
MSAENTHKETVTDRFELYLAMDADGLHKELEEDPVDEQFYPPGYGIGYIRLEQSGLHSFEDLITPLGYAVCEEPWDFEGEPMFCWHHGVMDPLEEHEGWFEQESIYETDERGGIRVFEHDVPIDVTLENAGGVTVVLEYTANPYSADDYMLQAQLFYGGPWNSSDEQYLAATVQLEHLPEALPEALGVIEVLFANNPVDDFTLCIFEDAEETEDDAETGSEEQ